MLGARQAGIRLGQGRDDGNGKGGDDERSGGGGVGALGEGRDGAEMVVGERVGGGFVGRVIVRMGVAGFAGGLVQPRVRFG